MKIAILGATSHIAKGLIAHFIHNGEDSLVLYARSTESVKNFLNSIASTGDIPVYEYPQFRDHAYDAVINCVGIGNPKKVKEVGGEIFRLTETYDNLVLDYLTTSPNTIYIHFSSGAAYGKIFQEAVTETSQTVLNINSMDSKDFYAIAKIHAEAKHRSLQAYKIIDLRVFNYFSRFIELNTGFLLTDIIQSILDKKEMITSPVNIVRDFISPSDLYDLIKLVLRHPVNDSFDTYSAKSITKFELLDFFTKEYNLQYRISEGFSSVNPTGNKDIYCSANKKAGKLGFCPKHSSLDGIREETRNLLV